MFKMSEVSLSKEKSEKLEKLENTIDDIREKYGSSIINRAVLIKKDIKGKK